MAFFALEQLSQLHDGYRRTFNIDGLSLLLLQLEGEVFLIENRCPHMDYSLSNSQAIPGLKIRCIAHGIEFDLNSGQACGPLAGTLDGLKKFPLIYDGNKVGVEIE